MAQQQHHITSHDPVSGAATFHTAPAASAPQACAFSSGTATALLYSHHSLPVSAADLAADIDIKQYQYDHVHGFAPSGGICPQQGVATMIASMEPGATTPMHRTSTVDTLIVIEGVVRLELNGGESRTLHVGDSVVLRAGMHRYINVSPQGGRVRILAVAVGVDEQEG